jgi:hypothetical protein
MGATRKARPGSIAGIGLAGAPTAAASVAPNGAVAPEPHIDATPGPQGERAPEPQDSTAPKPRVVVRKWAVRLYDLSEDEAWNTLWHHLRGDLGRLPSIAAASGVAAAQDPTVRAAIAAYLREHPRREQ